MKTLGQKRINLYDASRLAKELLSEQKEEYIKIEKGVALLVEREVSKMLPDIIKQAFVDEEANHYLYKRNNFYINDSAVKNECGTWGKRIYLDKWVPASSDDLKDILPEDKLEILTEEVLQMVKKERAYKSSLDKLSNYIYELRTYKKIISEFPKAEEFLVKNGGLPEDAEITKLKNLVNKK